MDKFSVRSDQACGLIRGRVSQDEENDGGVPCHCSGCAKFVRDGDGNQEMRGENLLRFCFPCWKKECGKVGMFPAQA